MLRAPGGAPEQQLLYWVCFNLDCKECMDVIYLDFSKAFDKISHSLLLLKLERRNIPRQLINWIASFLKIVGNELHWDLVILNGHPCLVVYPKDLYLVLYYSMCL